MIHTRRNIAILGAGGFLGRHLLARLSRDGHSVQALVRQGRRLTGDGVSIVARAFERAADFEDLLEGVDTIVHVASSNTVSSSHDDPVRELDRDLRSTVALVEALKNHSDIHVVYVSSGGTVYGDNHGDRPLPEGAQTRPKSYHGASKLAAEAFLTAWAAQNGNRLTIIRPANVYGPGQVPRAGFGVIPTVFDCLRSGTPFTIRGNVSSMRDYLYVDDFIGLLARVVGRGPTARPLVMNAASGTGVALGDLMALAEKVSGLRLERHQAAALDSEVNSLVLDPEKAHRLYDWKATTSFESGLSRTWEWFRHFHEDTGHSP